MSPARASRSAVAIDLFREDDCVCLLGANPRRRKEPIRTRVDLPPGEIDVAVNIVRRGSLTKIAEEIIHRLCSAIAAPIGEACRGADALALAQHGCLHLLPTGSGTVDGGRPLAAAQPVAQMPSTSYLRRIANAELPGFCEGVALLVGPEQGANGAVERAAGEIASALDGLGISFEILDRPRMLKSGTVLIVAAHGKPSQILMRRPAGHGEWLAAERFAASIGKPAISILAVCRSGTAEVAPDDEPLGLVWPLLTGGCHSVISSLWEVAAPAAAAFVGSLMRGISSGGGIGEVFADAFGKQMSDPRFPRLRDRGGFVLYGDWRLCLNPR